MARAREQSKAKAPERTDVELVYGPLDGKRLMLRSDQVPIFPETCPGRPVIYVRHVPGKMIFGGWVD